MKHDRKMWICKQVGTAEGVAGAAATGAVLATLANFPTRHVMPAEGTEACARSTKIEMASCVSAKTRPNQKQAVQMYALQPLRR